MPQPTYDFCLRFFSDLRALGIVHAVVSPGSRSTPLALSAQAAGLQISMQLDERVAGFFALGQAKGTGMPSVLICTSGTAGANYFPAVIEAHHSSTPLIVCTADRPPELRRWGAGQTIDQTHLFGSNVRWFHEVPVAAEVDPDHAGALALRCATSALHDSGPVHLNWPFREPLQPQGHLTPPASKLSRLTPRPPSARSGPLNALGEAHQNGLIVVGPDALSETAQAEIGSFARRFGWPVIADPASGLRASRLDPEVPVVTAGELLFASRSFTRDLPACEAIVRVGSSPTSKAYRLWIEGSPPRRLVLVAPGVEWSDPTASVTDVVPGPLEGLFDVDPVEERRSVWTQEWQRANGIAAGVIDDFLSGDESELKIARCVLDQLAASGQPATLMVSNSMPIRDVDAVMGRSSVPVRVLANRGANGIDGVVATAAGVAHASDGPTVLLIGDVATLHDLGGLAAVARLGLHRLTVVVIDNDGGGIFSFLPVAGALDPAVFEQLFATPHGTDLAAVAGALGFDARVLDRPDELADHLLAHSRPTLLLYRTAASVTTASTREMRRRVDKAFAGDW